MSSVKEDTIKGVKWLSIEKFVVQGVSFLLGLLMARLLSPSDYGLIGMLSIFMSVSSTFITSGFGNALVRKIDRTESDFCTVFYFNIVVSILFYFILFFLATWISEWFRQPVLCPVLRVYAISLILNALTIVQMCKLEIDVNFKAIAKRNIMSSIISGILGVLMAYFGWGVWTLVFQGLIANVLNLCFLFYYFRWIPKLPFSRKSFNDLFSYGSKLLTSGLLHTIYSNLTPLIIGSKFTSADLGFYSRGTGFASYPVSTVNGVLSQVTFPILARLQEDDSLLIHVYRKYICISSLVIFFACTLMAAIAKPLILLLLTEKWGEAIIYLQIFSFAIMFDHICSINLNLLQVKGRSDLFLRLEIIKKIIATLILFASIPFGVIGICVSKIIYTQIAVFINTYYTGKLFNLGYLTQLQDFMGFLICSIIACLPAWVMSIIDINYWLALLLGIIIAVLLYIMMLHNNKYYIELKTLILSRFF